jgi:hypothetical protein
MRSAPRKKMKGKDRRNKATDRLRPIDVPQGAIDKLVAGLGIDEATADDLVVFMRE